MFTGLVEEMGVLTASTPLRNGTRLQIDGPLVTSGLQLGDSVAVNGICQTVVDRSKSGFVVEAVGDTLEKTTVSGWKIGRRLNLERACRLDSRLGGHWVSGHIEGVQSIARWQPRGDSWHLEITLSERLRPYVMAEGSITIDGISLTVAELTPSGCRISVIPHTRTHTNLIDRRVGDEVNVEVDLLAKYLEHLLQFQTPAASLQLSKLRNWGY